MNTITRRAIQLFGLMLPLIGIGNSLQAGDWKVGDVFVAVGGGQYKVYRISGSTATVIDTITDSQGNGFTTGCAIDSTYHLYTTNFSHTKVVKFATPHPHAVLQTISTGSTSMSAASESIVFDGSGNFYVGHADRIVEGSVVRGRGKVEKYSPTGTLLTTFAPVVDGRGSDWIDLASDQKTLFYTSEGRKIKRFDVSGTGAQLTDFANLGEGGGPLFALRLLPPGNGTGGLLVADTDNIKRLNSLGGVVRTYGDEVESTWFALSLDPNGTSFWAGARGTALGTGHFYRFNIASGTVEVGPIDTGAILTGTGTGLNGICVYGGFSAAQPAPTVQILNLTPTNNSGTVLNDNNSNEFSVTLNGLSQPTKVAIRFSEINPSAGRSDTGLPCIIVSSDGTKCAVHQVEADTFAYTLAHLYHGWIKKGTKNPRMIKNESLDITTAQVIDPGVCGDTFPMSTYTANEAPLPTGAINCGFFRPVADGAVFNLGRDIPFRFEATTSTCRGGPFITAASGAQPRLSLAKVVPRRPPVPQPVMPSGASNVSNLFRIGDGRVWIYNASTKHLTAGDYIVTVFDLTNHIPPASVRISLR